MRFGLLLPTVLAGLALASASFAQDDPVRREAEARFAEGLALHNAENDEQARLKFAQAYSLVPSPAILFNLAAPSRSITASKPSRTIGNSSESHRIPRQPQDARGCPRLRLGAVTQGRAAED